MQSSAGSYTSRLRTFIGHWDENLTTARQLAAIGHACDRPPLESLEEGSRCLDCSRFLPKATSIRALEGPIGRNGSYTDGYLFFHKPKCIWLSLRIPTLEGQQSELSSLDFHDMRSCWEHRTRPPHQALAPSSQTSSLFSLPTELRLQIYSYILPALEPTTEVVPIHRDSIRMTTQCAFDKRRPRDKTKINILSTCKAVHSEALGLLYTNITYRFTSTRCMYLFLRHIGHTGRQRLKSVDFVCAGREDAISFALLASCETLKSITINLNRPMLLWARAPLWVMEGVECMLALTGLEDIKFGTSEARMSLKEGTSDAEMIRRELTRPKGTAGHVRIVDGVLNP